MKAASAPDAPGAARAYLASRTLASGIDAPFLERLAALAVQAGDRDLHEVPVPFTLERLGRVPLCRSADVVEAVRRARRAQPAWAALPPDRRARVLLRFHDLVLARQEQAADLIQLESGKARWHALEEVLDAALVARHYAFHARRYLRPRRSGGAFPLLTRAWTFRQPVGVVGAIAPWNFPLILGVTDLLAAVMAGNAAVLRPDLQASFTALWASALLREAGLPPDVLCVVTGEGEEVGAALVDHADYVMFTGSTRTGRIVAERAAGRLIGCSLELGGKNPMIVLADADVELAVDGAVRGAFVGAGQVCVSIERLFVHASIHDRFLQRFAERVRAMTLSAELEYGPDMGSLTTPQQLVRAEAHVRDALEKGATLIAGGARRQELGPLFFEPTVLAGVTSAMRVHAEETFGPVVAVYRFATDDEAITRANETRYGLNASVWSRNRRRAMRLARRIRAGTVNVNEPYGATWSATGAPIGGMAESGLGRRHGEEGILKYTEAQTVGVQRWLPLAPLPGMTVRRSSRLLNRLWKLIRWIPGLR